MAQEPEALTGATDLKARGAGIIMDQKLEVVIIAVSDVGRATEFYGSLGWRQDVTPSGIVQFTPPGSGCSVQFGTNLTSAAPGSAKGYLPRSRTGPQTDTGRRRHASRPRP